MKSTDIPGILLVALFIIAIALPPNVPAGQTQTSGEILRVPCQVNGYVGGESHDTYRIAVTKGERLEIRVTWRRADHNRAEATVSTNPDFGAGEPLASGQWSRDRGRWTGKIDESGIIYLFVVAHPSAYYRVTIRRLRAKK